MSAFACFRSPVNTPQVRTIRYGTHFLLLIFPWRRAFASWYDSNARYFCSSARRCFACKTNANTVTRQSWTFEIVACLSLEKLCISSLGFF